ncbi:MAG: electron transfer flavoprotein subunit alpha/FixB family protein [Candidatus Njordarchaeia archaeon]
MSWALIFSEDKKLVPDLITASKRINIDDTRVVLIDQSVDEEYAKGLGKYGAKKVYVYEGPELEKVSSRQYAEILIELIKESNPEIILIGGTLIGNEVASIVGASFDSPIAVEVLDMGFKEGEFYVKRAIYGGKLVQDLKLIGERKIIVISPGAYEAEEIGGGEAQIEKKTIPQFGEEIKVVEKKMVTGEGKPIEEADIVIGAGRGIKNKEDLKMIYELAELLGAAVGCTRPLSADYGWFDDWIGVSGKRIRPKLYLAIGISGSVQHMSGVRASKLIIAINKDGEAPILEEADYLFVADLYKLVPEIINVLKSS